MSLPFWILRWFGVSAFVLLVASQAAAQAPASSNSCETCHSSLPDARLSTPARLFSDQDVHRERGFACVDCHGGNAGAAEKTRAHDPARSFKGKPAGQAVTATCARCHSDGELMHRYSPRQRVDQAVEYATSVHGKRLQQGDANVATCASCHGAHGTRMVKDAKSPVFPTNVAATCATCHASPQHMRSYKLPDGKPLPTNQFAEYQESVHFAALTKANDLSAPTCNDCHGNHGAAPPGVGTVTNVCGTCHAVFAQAFETSSHQAIFDKGCVECHSNHAVLKPTDEMLGTSAQAICSTCHSGADDKGAQGADSMRRGIDRLKVAIGQSGALVDQVKNAGIEVSAEEVALADARSHLTLARTVMHSSDPKQVEPVIQEGLKIVASVDGAGREGLRELRFRRTGLAISLAAIVLVVIAIVLKIRQLDRRHAAEDADTL